MFVLTMGHELPVKIRHGADAALAVSAIGLLVLIVGARHLESPLRKLFTRLPHGKLVEKLEHWLLLAVDTLGQLGISGSLFLLLQTAVIWTVKASSSSPRYALQVSPRTGSAPWEAVSFANLSYMLPSSPGAIGPFEWAVKTSLSSHGAQQGQAALFALALHVWMLISITGAGGLIFLLHRAKFTTTRRYLKRSKPSPPNCRNPLLFVIPQGSASVVACSCL